MTNKVFAPEYERNDSGWVRFPRDQAIRKEYFIEEVNQHPAKANVYLVKSIIEFVSEPGQTVCDVMAGTGTILMGLTIGRKVVCIEISSKFAGFISSNVEKFKRTVPNASDMVTVINAPCQTVLPIPNLADHIIFSPQYAGILNVSDTKKKEGWMYEASKYDWAEYTKSPLNLGNMSEFLWSQEMAVVYKKCHDSVPVGGTMTIITKDHMRQGNRVLLSQMAASKCIEFGFILQSWEKWAAPGLMFTSARKARGEEVVEDEDIITFRRVK